MTHNDLKFLAIVINVQSNLIFLVTLFDRKLAKLIILVFLMMFRHIKIVINARNFFLK